MRIALVISYNGTAYCGWQNQKNGIAVQQKIEEALFKLTGEKISITGAGRTDAGVHAIGQIAHFDTRSNIPPEKFSYALNTHLPYDIRIKDSFLARDDFHARYDAVLKHYKYVVCNDKHASAVLCDKSLHEPRELDIAAMRKAASLMTGTHDYSAFCAAGAQTKTFTRTVYKVDISQKDNFIEFDFTGNGFLYNMVRIMVGTLLYVGMGKLSAEDIPDIIESKDRTRAGITVEPQGLYLYKVEYKNIKKA